MTNKALSEIIERAKSWPDEAQRELAEIARDMDAGLRGDIYHPSEEEIAGIERGLRAANEGRFASEQEVEAIFAKYRR